MPSGTAKFFLVFVVLTLARVNLMFQAVLLKSMSLLSRLLYAKQRKNSASTSLWIVVSGSIPVSTMADQDITASDDMSGGDPVWRGIEDLPDFNEVMDEWIIMPHKDLLEWWHRAEEA